MSHLITDTGVVFGRYARQTLGSRVALLFGLLQPLLFLVLFGPLLEEVPLGGRGDSWQTLVPGLLVQLGLFSSAFAGFGIWWTRCVLPSSGTTRAGAWRSGRSQPSPWQACP